MDDMPRARGGAGSSMPTPGALNPSTPTGLKSRSSLIPVLWGIYAGMTDCHWPLTKNSASSPFPFPGTEVRVGLKVPALSSAVGSTGAHPGTRPTSHR